MAFSTLLAQSGDGYDPSNPGDPNPCYRLYLEASPRTGGSVNNGSTQLLAGQTHYCSASPNFGYDFKHWMMGDSVVSTKKNFYFVMPAENVTLIAYFEWNDDYNPNNPGDPSIDGYAHDVNIYASPSTGGYFNKNYFKMIEGTSTNIYAYPNTNYRFVAWKKNGTIISTSNPLEITMGDTDLAYTATFTYDPANPGNPAANSFNPVTGELIIDDFNSGSLNSAIQKALGNHGYSEVQSIIVDGEMNSSDFGFYYYMNNCSLIDLSRTTGYTQIPYWAFEEMRALTKIILPASVTYISNYAFYGCDFLSELVCYATEPPVVNSYAFDSSLEGLVVRVPSSSVSYYEKAAIWENFTILPLDEETGSLIVNLPEDADDGRYKNMIIELKNISNGQAYRYIITDKTSYTFNNLISNFKYNVIVKNSSGAVLGCIYDVMITDEEEMTVTFESLLQPQNVYVKVITPDGKDVTNKSTVTWYDNNGKYLTQGSVIKGILENTKLRYRIDLSQDLAMQYILPTETELYVKSTNNNITVELLPFEEITLSGYVRDKSTKSAISNASVSISQTLNGKYSKSVVVTTNNTGSFTVTVFNTSCKVVVAANDYLSNTLIIDDIENTEALNNILLKSITGVRINTLFTYTESVAEGETANTQNYYNDYANVSYRVFSKTTNHELTNFNVQYPYIVLLGNVSHGEELSVTVFSRTGMFVDVTADCVVDENDYATVTLPIVELGELQASYNYSETSDVVAILYDANGQFLTKSKYNGKSVTFSNLVDGNYKLVSMMNSDILNSILNLSEFGAVGLLEGRHYIINDVTIQSGLITDVSIDEIFPFDESEFYYTGDNTQFTVNKQSVTVGNYVTLRAKVDFKSQFVNDISDVKLIFDLPSSCDFVDNSVMTGNMVSSYTIGENRIEVELANTSDLVRFCVVPMEGGSCTPTAFVQFKLAGEEILQPIGGVTFEAKSLEINIPSITASKEIAVSGVCKGNSLVEIYDNDVLVSTVTSLAHGAWSTKCELNNAYNLSTHKIYAKVAMNNEMNLQSETKEVLYDMNAIQVSKVTMYYNNYEIIYDFINPNNKSNYWVYNGNINYTYTIEFTDNSPEKVMNVILYVHTLSGNIFPYEAEYNEEKGLWIVNCELIGEYPVNVSLDFDYISTNDKVDSSVYDDVIDNEGLFMKDYGSLIDTISYIVNNESIMTEEEWEEFYVLMGLGSSMSDVDTDIDFPSDFDSWTEQEQEEYISQILSEMETEYEALSIEFLSYQDMFRINSTSASLQFDDGSGINVMTCEGITAEMLLEQGFTEYESLDGSMLYILFTSEKNIFVDFDNNMYVETNTTFMESLRIGDEFMSLIRSISNIYGSWNDSNVGLCISILDNIKSVFENANIQFTNLLKNAEVELFSKTSSWLNTLSHQQGRYNQLIRKAPNSAMAYVYREYLSDVMAKKAIVQALHSCIKPAFKLLARSLPISNWISIMGDLIGYAYDVRDIYTMIDNKKCLTIVQKNDFINQNRMILGRVGAFASGTIIPTVFGDAEIFVGILGTMQTGGTSLGVSVMGFIVKSIAQISTICLGNMIAADIIGLKNAINAVECPDPDPDPNNPNPNNPNPNNPNPGPGQHKPNQPDDEVQIDPSGFVYEGVSSNRVEGVMASCYYKEFVEDMYGDLIEKVVLWDAEAYAQENPLFTDENGMYRWDVPQGLWQVKFEKEGYETTYSDWLPVPPPQLEVNIPMTQYSQPNVTFARAYQNAIEVHFDKYMMPAYLTTDNIVVTVDGNDVEGTIELLNEEVCYEGMSNKFASKVRFNADEPFQAEEVTLTVKNSVRSYANIRMQDDFSQSFTVEVEIQKIVCAPTLQVNYNEETEIIVSVIPAVASKGKTLNVVSQAPIILSVDTTSYIINEEGQVKINVKGELPGSASLMFSVEGYDINAQSLVKVEQKKVYESKQTTTLNEGWNWYSTYLEINGKDGLTRLQNSMDGKAEQIKSQVAFSSYESGNWFGLLENARTEDMYMIKMSEDTEINLSGNIADPSEHPITLNQNWTWFGYILNENMSLKEGLVNFTPNDGDYIKSQSGFNTYYNGNWYGEIILDFEVGKGYMYKNTSDAAKTLVYPKVSSKGRQIRKTSSEKYWTADINKYPTNMSIIAAVNMDGEEMSEYEIGAFCNGECRGSARPVYIEELDRYMIFLSVNGDDNDEISFRYYDVASNEEYEYDAAERIDYYANGTLGTMTEPYIFNFGSMSIDDYTHYSLEIYPNPVDKNNEIHLGTICERVEVYNSLGVKIADYKNVGTIEGIDIPGVYIINAVNKNNVKYCRLIVK